MAKTKKDNQSFKIQCPCCEGVYFETTDKFDSAKKANPAMLRLTPPYNVYGWTEPIPDETAGYGIIVCPECDSLIAPDGKLKLVFWE